MKIIITLKNISKWSNSGNETSSEYANWSGLVHCDDESECQGIFGNSIPTQCSKIYSHSRNGICAPRNCQHNNTDCPIIGDECTSGAISGECNNNSTQCDYAPFLMVAYCIPGKSLNSPALFYLAIEKNYKIQFFLIIAEGDRGRTSKVSNSCNSCGDGPGAACICKTLLHNASELLSVKFGIIEILVVYYLLK